MIKDSLLALSLFGALTSLAHSAGESALFKHTVISKFNGDDMQMMMAAVVQSLKTGENNSTSEWKNDKTRASGSVTPYARDQWKGLACRSIRIVATYSSESQQAVYRFCQSPVGQWKLVGPDTAPR